MAKIYEMPQHLADLIAAGEVVERPASVVKELIENSIDAGAKSITVEIRGGGMEMIRITDNGCGMSPEDAKKAFLRHATSKLRTERDLEAIGTLGFRGEALAAISAVSHAELLTRETGAAEGTRMALDAGTVTECRPEGCPDGTTIIIRDLFFNTPARLKFMKNDRAEGSAVTGVVLRAALSHPEISVRYIREGKEECHTPGDGKTDSCVYSTLGRDFAAGMLPASCSEDGVSVTGYVSSPAACRGNRTWQIFFLNGRVIKSRLLQAAVEQAYRNVLFTGRFPACVLFITMKLSAVDVNVHPTKAEVRFADEKKAFDAVYWATKNALGGEERKAELKIPEMKPAHETPIAAPAAKPAAYSPKAPAAPASGYSFKTYTAETKPRGDFFRTVTANEYLGLHNSKSGGFKTSVPAFSEGTRREVHDSTNVPYQTSITMPREPEPEIKAPEAEAVRPAPEYTGPDFRLIGEALDTYIVVESGESIFLIDKHAAHERINFDRLKSADYEPAGQMLITPVICRVGGETAELIEENADLLAKFGFETDRFGADSIAVRQLPAEIDVGDAQAVIEELAEKLRTGHGIENLRDGIMKTMACKAAIKAGRRSEPGELYGLVRKVLSGEVKYCPHGRPVAMEITRSQLDRGFKRA